LLGGLPRNVGSVTEVVVRRLEFIGMWQKVVLLAITGAMGTLLRYGLASLVQRAAGGSFPWGTMVVNVVGCLVAGVLWVLAEELASISGETRAIIFVGFMGAFTTFSALIAETGGLVRDERWAHALGNLAMHNVLGLAVFFAGLALGRVVCNALA